MKMITVREHKLEVLEEVAQRVESGISEMKMGMLIELTDKRGQDEVMLAFHAEKFLEFTKDRARVKRLRREMDSLLNKYGL